MIDQEVDLIESRLVACKISDCEVNRSMKRTKFLCAETRLFPYDHHLKCPWLSESRSQQAARHVSHREECPNRSI